MTEDSFVGEWDLGEVLVERDQPTDKVDVYLNEVASYAKARLMQAHATASADAVTAIDEQLDKIEKDLENSRYVVHIRAVPSRMREDIASKALAQFPLKLNMFGQDDSSNALDRKKYENDLIWHAQIVNVENPHGRSKTNWTFEQMQKFANSLPTAAQRAIDAKIREVTELAEQYTVKSQDIDFS